MLNLTVLGCGDAFGAGGRLQTCFHIRRKRGNFLLDCGATALIGMQAQGLDPDAVDQVVLSHLHGDHFSGLVWWLIHAHHGTRRTRPLTVVGPEGTAQRLEAASEVLFPGSWGVPRRFELTIREFAEGERVEVDGIGILPFAGRHPSGSLSAALRLEVDGRTLSFSGDTEWVDDLVPCAADADLCIMECYAFEPGIRYHLNWMTIAENLDRMTARKVMLTHMNAEMLARRGEVSDPRVVLAEDGLRLEV